MNTQELDDLADWAEEDLSEVIVEFARSRGRLPHGDELSRLTSPQAGSESA